MTGADCFLPQTILVTAADAGFFELLRDLLLSIAAHRPPAKHGSSAALGVFDLGLTAEQRAWVADRVDHVVEPGWDLVVPEDRRTANPHLRALTVRPFLPRYFPGYENYLWVDADVWLQHWQVVDLYVGAAQRAQLAAATHSDRCYPMKLDVFQYRHRVFAAGFGEAEANDLCFAHHLNAGIFAARGDSPLWAGWAEVFQSAIDASGGRVVNDQTALNYLWHRRGLAVHLLPATCNWQCHLAVPAWRPDLGLFCEPFLPNAVIGAMHLTHRSKDALYQIDGLDGRRRRMMLRYRPAARRRAAAATRSPRTKTPAED